MKPGKVFVRILQSRPSKRIYSILKYLVSILGIIYLALIIFAFTSGPFWIYYWLGTSNIKPYENTEYFILLGGGGMPEESNLMRSYLTAKIANEVTGAKIIIALPGDTSDMESSIHKLANELIVKGISPERIIYETEGANTRAQALEIADSGIPGIKNKYVTLITSPEHMKRSILTFRKLGFSNVNGQSAFHIAIETDIKYNKKDIGGKNYVPDVGSSISFRYRFWTHLKYEILIIREFMALFYYKLNGWI
jgi:uncharacterized SAM-binding protein YcdF (DUF218 family)